MMTIKIQKNVFIVLVIGFVISVGIFITIIFNPGQRPISQAQTNQNDTRAINGTESSNVGGRQTGTMGAVQIDIEPKKLGRDESENIFTVYFNTHSVELDFDFSKIMVLRDEAGTTYQALRWTGNRGWHHVSGDIIFPRLKQNAKQVTVEIAGIEGQTKNFKWFVP